MGSKHHISEVQGSSPQSNGPQTSDPKPQDQQATRKTAKQYQISTNPQPFLAMVLLFDIIADNNTPQRMAMPRQYRGVAQSR